MKQSIHTTQELQESTYDGNYLTSTRRNDVSCDCKNDVMSQFLFEQEGGAPEAASGPFESTDRLTQVRLLTDFWDGLTFRLELWSCPFRCSAPVSARLSETNIFAFTEPLFSVTSYERRGVSCRS